MEKNTGHGSKLWWESLVPFLHQLAENKKHSIIICECICIYIYIQYMIAIIITIIMTLMVISTITKTIVIAILMIATINYNPNNNNDNNSNNIYIYSPRLPVSCCSKQHRKPSTAPVLGCSWRTPGVPGAVNARIIPVLESNIRGFPEMEYGIYGGLMMTNDG